MKNLGDVKFRLLLQGPVGMFLKNGGTYLGFTVINKIIPFLLLPLLTTYIDPSGYGKISMFMIIVSLSMMVIGLCSNTVITQRYYKSAPEERLDLLKAAYYSMLGVYAVVALLALVLGPIVSQALNLELLWVEVALACGFTGMIATMQTTLFQLRKQAINYGIFQGSNALLNVLLSLLLVVKMGYAWQGRIVSISITFFLFALIVIYNMSCENLNLIKLPEKKHIMTIVKLGGALVPAGISGWTLAMSDRIFLNKLVSLEAVGIYSVAITIAQVADFTFNSVGQAYMPFFYERIYRDDYVTKIKMVRATYVLMLGYMAFAAGMVIFSPAVLKLMTNVRFHKAAGIVGIMSCSYALMAMGYLFYNFVISAERNILTTYISYLTLCINIIANYFFIKRFGINGAAFASVVSSGAFLISNIAVTIHCCKMPWLDAAVFQFLRKDRLSHTTP